MILMPKIHHHYSQFSVYFNHIISNGGLIKYNYNHHDLTTIGLTYLFNHNENIKPPKKTQQLAQWFLTVPGCRAPPLENAAPTCRPGVEQLSHPRKGQVENIGKYRWTKYETYGKIHGKIIAKEWILKHLRKSMGFQTFGWFLKLFPCWCPFKDK